MTDFDRAPRERTPDWATVPNAITALRLLLVIPIAVLLVDGASPVVTLLLLALFGASDWIDGYLARRLGQTSRTGAILDPVADRVGVAVIAFAFVLGGHLPLWMASTVAGVDLVLAGVYLGVRPSRSPAVSGLGKVRTAVLMTGLALIGLGLLPGFGVAGLVGQVVCGAGAVTHVIAGIGYVRAILRP